MKQRITPQQLSQLNEKGKERLREWWEPQAGDRIYIFVHKISDWDYDDDCVVWNNEILIEEEMLPLVDIRDQLVNALWSTCVEILNREWYIKK